MTTMNVTSPQQQLQQQHRANKASVLRAVNIFDDLCVADQTTKMRRKPFGFDPDSDDAINRVKFLEDKDIPPPTDAFFKVPYKQLAGLKTSDADIENKSYETHYLREEVKMLWQEIDELPYKKNLFIQGQPGTGKSSAVWRKVLEMAHQGDNILWVTLSTRSFVKKAVYFQGRYFLEVGIVSTEEIHHFHSGNNIPLNTIILDGVIEEPFCDDLLLFVENWVRDERSNSRARAIYTASAKVKKKREHQNETITYVTVHSWTIEEFKSALVHEGHPTTLFKTCADLFSEENDEFEDDDLKKEQEISERLKNELSRKRKMANEWAESNGVGENVVTRTFLVSI